MHDTSLQRILNSAIREALCPDPMSKIAARVAAHAAESVARAHRQRQPAIQPTGAEQQRDA